MPDSARPTPTDALKQLFDSDAASAFCLPGGSALFLAGEPSDNIYWLRTGRLAALQANHDHDGSLIGLIHPGEPVGEMALIGGGAHSADVVALRDSEISFMAREAFFKAVAHTPALMTELAQRMLSRMRPQQHIQGQPSVFGFCAVQAGLKVRALVESIAAIMRDHGHRVTVAGAEAQGSPGQRFCDAEQEGDFVLYAAEPDEEDWIPIMSRQVDRLFRVAAGEAHPPPHLAAVPGETPYSQRLTDLILIQKPHCRIPSGSAAWTKAVKPDRLFHVRQNRLDDLQRLARVITGQAVGLVLSGGAARAYAHIGAIRTLRAAKIPIDFVAGVSMGAIIAAGLAMGWDDRELDRRIRRAFVNSNPVDDIALPLIAMTRGGKVRARLAQHFGEQQICDLWLPFFCVSANLTTGQAEIHRHGRLVDALNASGALPGFLPPVLKDKDVLVDGAVLNNFPADIMRQIQSGPIVGVDVSRGRSVAAGDITTMSLWRWFLSGEWRKGPPIVSLLMRAATLSSTRELRAAREAVDVLILPMVDHIEVRDWKAYDEAVEAGALAARDALAKLTRPVTDLRRPPEPIPS